MKWRYWAALALIPGFVGCSAAPEPYVHREAEFNRGQRFFGKRLENREEVIICFNRSNATRAAIDEIARAECASYGKTAAFYELRLDPCPLVTPIAAEYKCTGGRPSGGSPYDYKGGDYRGGVIDGSSNFLYYGKPPIPTAPLDLPSPEYYRAPPQERP